MQKFKEFIQSKIAWFIAITLLMTIMSFFRIGMINNDKVISIVEEQNKIIIELQQKFESTKSDNVVSLVNSLVIKNDKIDSLINVTKLTDEKVIELISEIQLLKVEVNKLSTEINKEK